ncbi:MAG: RIP metalloprotease RseP [Terriglobia bacterium]|jgi:regulator of sigma E protease
MFSNALTAILVVIVVLGVMILIHELGHFLAAKYFGVRVLTFSLGFGPRLFGIKRGDTDYRVSGLPFGGYVKMAGDDPSQDREGDPGEFLSKPRWQRFIIVVMGPTMNAVLAIVVLAGLYRFHYEKPAYLEEPVRIGEVDPSSPAAQAGIQPGDMITRLGDLVNPNWEDAEIKVLTSANEPLSTVVFRDGKEYHLTVTPKAQGAEAVGGAGWRPFIPAVIEEADAGYPAGKAGLKAGDQILALDGRKINFLNVNEFLQAGKGSPITLTVQRAGKVFDVPLTPIYGDVKGEKKWRIGVLFRSPVVVRQLAWGQALATSVEFNVTNATLAFEVLQKILTRRMSPRALSGPVGITQMAGEAYREGWPQLLTLTALISMQLAIFNILPIPVLDGGVILLLAIEGTLRHDLSLRVKERFVQVGLAILLLLVAVVTYFDIVKSFRAT